MHKIASVLGLFSFFGSALSAMAGKGNFALAGLILGIFLLGYSFVIDAYKTTNADENLVIDSTARPGAP